MSFRILVVCTGNLCRSPIAERLFRRRVQEWNASEVIEVSSAGTNAPIGAPMDPRAARALRAHQGDDTGFSSRLLLPELLPDVDLLLAATREHRTTAVTMAPRLLRRAFTLLEFARLARTFETPGPHPIELEEQARALVERAGARRGSVRAATPADDDLPDPMGREPAAFDEAARTIQEAVSAILRVLVPPRLADASQLGDQRFKLTSSGSEEWRLSRQAVNGPPVSADDR